VNRTANIVCNFNCLHEAEGRFKVTAVTCSHVKIRTDTFSHNTYVVCQAMEHTGRCVAVSEPVSPNVVGTKYRKFGDSPEIRQLARDVIRCECRPYPTIQPPPLAYLIKINPVNSPAVPMFR